MHVVRNADAWLVGILLMVTLALAGHALGGAAADAADRSAGDGQAAREREAFDRLRAAAPFAGGVVVQPGEGEPHS